MKLIYLVLFTGLAHICLTMRTYEGYRVLRIPATTEEQVQTIRDLVLLDEYDFWATPRRAGGYVDVLVSPLRFYALNAFLRKHGLQFSTLVENVEQKLNKEKERLDKRRTANGKLNYDFNDYNDYDAMIQQLEYFAGNCSAPLSCSLEVIGNTYEGRPMHQLIVSTAPDDDSRMGFWFDSLIHAREWLSGTSVMNIINHMLSGYSVDEEVTYLLDSYNFYFVPVMNPDGYIYTWEQDRFWRKSRNVNDGSQCIGTDLNRNYDQSWGTDGTSSNPCSDTYCGSSAGSEPETQVIQARSSELGPHLHAFVTAHTAANMYLHPYGNTLDGECERTPDHDHQYQVAEAMAIATMAEYDTLWTYGTVCETIYPASGGTQDYVYAKAGVKYTFTPELRGPGFDPDPEHIEPGWREYWSGIKAMIAEIESIEGLSK